MIDAETSLTVPKNRKKMLKVSKYFQKDTENFRKISKMHKVKKETTKFAKSAKKNLLISENSRTIFSIAKIFKKSRKSAEKTVKIFRQNSKITNHFMFLSAPLFVFFFISDNCGPRVILWKEFQIKESKYIHLGQNELWFLKWTQG